MTLLRRACVSSISMTMYVVPFLRYSASKNGVTLIETGDRRCSRSLKMAPFGRSYTTV